MTDADLLVECKKGLNIPVSSTAFDDVLNQKLLAVKGYMNGAGVSATVMDSDLAVGVIVMGVTDLWSIKDGETSFSPVFHTLLTQLAVESLKLLLSSSNPVDGATGVSIGISPILTFNKRVSGYDISLLKTADLSEKAVSISLDLTQKVLTIDPDSDLDAATEYAIVISSVTAVSGPTLSYTVIKFTTA